VEYDIHELVVSFDRRYMGARIGATPVNVQEVECYRRRSVVESRNVGKGDGFTPESLSWP